MFSWIIPCFFFWKRRSQLNFAFRWPFSMTSWWRFLPPIQWWRTLGRTGCHLWWPWYHGTRKMGKMESRSRRFAMFFLSPFPIGSISNSARLLMAPFNHHRWPSTMQWTIDAPMLKKHVSNKCIYKCINKCVTYKMMVIFVILLVHFMFPLWKIMSQKSGRWKITPEIRTPPTFFTASTPRSWGTPQNPPPQNRHTHTPTHTH